MTVPDWANNAYCASLLAKIVADRPDAWMMKRYAWVNARYPRFKGEEAKDLRRYWQVQVDLAMFAGDHEAFAELHREEPDDLIDRLLRAPINNPRAPHTPGATDEPSGQGGKSRSAHSDRRAA